MSHAIVLTLLYIVNSPDSRQFIRPNLELEVSETRILKSHVIKLLT